MRPQPLISVTDVPRSSRWYQDLLEIALAPHRNPPDGPGGPAHREIWLRDLDGYLVVLASPDGESPWPDPRFA